MNEPGKSLEVAHATPALIQAVAELGAFADRYRYPNAAVLLVVGRNIVVRVPETDNAAFERAGWQPVRDSVWVLDTRDPEYAKKKTVLWRVTPGLTETESIR